MGIGNVRHLKKGREGMTARIGVRLDDVLRERLTAVAQARGGGYSTVLREALEAYLAGVSAAREAPTPLAAGWRSHAGETPIAPSERRTGDEPVTGEREACGCCGEMACLCQAQDWCLHCWRCYAHCGHPWAAEWREGARTEPPPGRLAGRVP